MDRRDRTAPIALARNAPVAQAILRRALAQPHFLDFPDRRRDGVFDGKPVQKTGIENRARAHIGLVGDCECRRVLIRRQHDRRNRQIIFAREIEVALIA